MVSQCLSVSMILIVLSLVQINATRHRSIRQTQVEGCPHPNFAFCDFIQCDNGGECVGNKTSVDCYSCNCAPGFTGKLCDVEIVSPSGCNPPCENGGTCQQTPTNTRTCVCASGYTGSRCETPVIATHPCVTNPTICQNGGTCNMNQANYLCSCAIGFTGTNCERKETITTCDSNSCGTHGTCIQAILPTGPGILCNCESQWTGKYCDVNLDDRCPVGFCLSGGTCRTNGSMPICICPPTHTGTRCEAVIGTQPTTTTTSGTNLNVTTTTPLVPNPGRCTSVSCSNGGTCYNTGNSFICLCAPQWGGATCNVQNSITTSTPTAPLATNACSPNPCQNGGSCYSYAKSYVCHCPSQYTGPSCAVLKTTIAPSLTTPTPPVPCASQPCQNGGACYNTGPSYFCYCGSSSKFTGTNCETPIAPVSADCPLECGTGYCVRSGGQQVAYACMCNGTLTPNRC